LRSEVEKYGSEIAMNIEEGLTLRLIPMGMGGSGAMKTKPQKMDINVTIQLDYLVL